MYLRTASAASSSRRSAPTCTLEKKPPGLHTRPHPLRQPAVALPTQSASHLAREDGLPRGALDLLDAPQDLQHHAHTPAGQGGRHGRQAGRGTLACTPNRP